MKLNFRPLKAEEIECRISTVKKTGVSLLLYKDARVDMRLLDETVGQMNWKRSHQLIDGNLYCTIEIWDDEKNQWIGKQDVGTESFTEKEKGQASDSFKRAGFNFGIGRELYTAPFIWIPSSKCQIEEKGNGYTCYDRFDVKSIEIVDGNIVSLEVVNEKTGNLVFAWSKDKSKAQVTPEAESIKEGQKKIDKAKQKALEEYFKKLNVNGKDLIAEYGANSISDLTEDAHYDIIRRLKAAEERLAKATKPISVKDAEKLLGMVNESGINIDKLLKLYSAESFKVLTYKQYDNILNNWDKILERCK